MTAPDLISLIDEPSKRRRTVLTCPLGNHRGHFELTRFGDTWGCSECIRLAGRQFVGLAIAQTAGVRP